MASTLESRINYIVARAAHEIAAVVRQEISAEVAKAISTGAVLPRRRGRPPKAFSSGAVGRGPGRPRGRGGKRGPNSVTVDRVLSFVKANPGKRTEEISKALGQDAKPALAKLRATRAVKTRGQKRATTYAAA